jgi:hypothetical protein
MSPIGSIKAVAVSTMADKVQEAQQLQLDIHTLRQQNMVQTTVTAAPDGKSVSKGERDQVKREKKNRRRKHKHPASPSQKKRLAPDTTHKKHINLSV